MVCIPCIIAPLIYLGYVIVWLFKWFRAKYGPKSSEKAVQELEPMPTKKQVVECENGVCKWAPKSKKAASDASITDSSSTATTTKAKAE